MRKLTWSLSMLAVLGLLLAACSPSTGTPPADPGSATSPTSDSTSAAMPPGSKILKTSFLSGDVPTLDPALAEDSSSIQVLQETMVGLTRLNEVTNALEPGMAFVGPAIIEEAGATTVIPPGLPCDVDDYGDYHIRTAQ